MRIIDTIRAGGVVALLAFPALAGGPAKVSAHPTTIDPLVPCTTADNRAALDSSEAPCPDEEVFNASNDRILEAKTAAADAYVGTLQDSGSQDDYAQAEAWLLTATGEGAIRADAATIPLDRDNRLSASFKPFAQTTDYYCGPATVESILSFLGATTSWASDPITGSHDALTGDADVDQPLLANDFWLRADANDGTAWGAMYVPFALNAWRGSRWYVAASTPKIPGGTLTKDEALRDIRYDVDHGYPVAENVLYSPQTYYPAGFTPGVRYTHWDTIYGAGGYASVPYVDVGQVFHEPSTEYRPYQRIDWDRHWTAIAAWHGIVW